MKVGILTYCETPNFGSNLQAFALWKAVSEQIGGGSCELINYRCASVYQYEKIKLEPFHSLKSLALSIISFTLRSIKFHKCQQFLSQNTVMSKRRYDRSEIQMANYQYGVFMVGSDIVWGTDINGGDMTFFLDFVQQGKKKIAFSSSVATPWTSTEKKQISPLLQSFDYIATREDRAADWVEELTGNRPDVVCDPTMMLGPSVWAQLKSNRFRNKHYVLVYFPDETLLQKAKEVASLLHIDCYVIMSRISVNVWYKGVCPMSIPDFLSLFYYADFIITKSFRGFCFANYFNRPYLYFSKMRKSRIDGLAQRLDVTDRNGDGFDVARDDLLKVHWEVVNRKMEEMRKYSLGCLNRCLNETVQ